MGVRAGRDPVPAYLVQRLRGRHLVLPQRAHSCGSYPEYEDRCWVLPDVLLDHVNKALKRMWTDKTRAKMSYSTITQKMTLHMTPGTDFSMPYQSAMGTILGFYPSLVTSPARDRDTRVYTHPRVGEETNRAYPPELSLTPSATVTSPPEKTKTTDSPYSFRQEANTVVNMHQGFDTIYVYTDVVESRIVGDSLVPLLRCLPIVSLTFTTCLCCARSSGP